MREGAGAPAAVVLPPCLLVDRTLGRLARWLRLLGYDAVWERSAGPAELLARAQAESRGLLTRDTLLVERRAVRRGLVRAVLVRDDLVADQLRRLRIEQGLRRVAEPRCLVCNGPLEPRVLRHVRDRVPPYVARTQTRFSFCPACDRVTWPATHWESMQRRLAEAGFGVEGDRTERAKN
ncbi:MAG: Mut7-C RNAse domain-containing protein [bacterium]